jgi:molybdopterin/thiamine biosynthesis adenylyltransferase
MPAPLSPEETRRYARHIVLKGIGGAGQAKLTAARVLVIGAGGLGSPVIAYLAAAGVGTLGVMDDDVVSLSNLQRQILHTTSRMGQQKTESAKSFAQALNPHVAVVPHQIRFNETHAAVFGAYDIVVDGSDNLPTRRAAAQAAEAFSKPLVFGAVSVFDGQVTVFAPHLEKDGKANPRFSSLYPEDADPNDLPSCEAVGIVGAVTGVIGTLMAMEAIKLITGLGDPLIGRLLIYDGQNARFDTVRYT